MSNTEISHDSSAFSMLAALLALTSDPAATKSRMNELRSTLAALSQAQGQLAADRLALAELERTTKAECEEQRALWLRRQNDVKAKEIELAEREKICLERERELGWTSGAYSEFVEVPGTSMTKSNEHRLTREGFAGDAFPRESTLTRAFSAPEPPTGARIRPRHLRRGVEL